MKQFLKKLSLILLLPTGVILISLIIWDPFLAYFSYSSYNVKTPIAKNRDLICMRQFKMKTDRQSVNSFIIGNSRSQAFRATDFESIFKNYLGEKVNCFHFDGNGLGFYRMNNLIHFLDQQSNPLEHVLLVFDHGSFDERENSEDYLNIQAPELTGESTIKYYFTFIRASMVPQFITSNFEFRMTQTYKPYFKGYLKKINIYDEVNDYNGDVYWGYEEEIKKDSLAYYAERMKEGIFFERSKISEISKPEISAKQIKELKVIRQIFDKHNSKFDLVIGPMYDQIAYNPKDIQILNSIFGAEHVHNYSGMNKYTASIGNYYEFSHFRPHVARSIMKQVFLGQNDSLAKR